MSQTLYPEVVQQLKDAGYELFRCCKGSHRIYKKSNRPTIILSRNLKSRHEAKAILKLAGCMDHG